MNRNHLLIGTIVLLLTTASVAPFATASAQPPADSIATVTTDGSDQSSKSAINTNRIQTDNNSTDAFDGIEKHPKLSSGVRRAIDSSGDGSSLTQSDSGTSSDDQLQIVVEAAPGRVDRVAKLIKSNDGHVEIRQGRSIQARVPTKAIDALADSSAVSFVRLPYRPEPTEIQTRALEDMNVSEARENGYTGKNVTVALITATGVNLESDEVDNVVATKNYTSAPLNVGPDDNPHGTATAELVQDVAPNASLVVVRIGTYMDAQQAAEWVTENTSADIVSMSLGWRVAGPLNGEDPLSNDIQRSSQAGVSWFVSAGNAANHHWNGTWQDGDGGLC